MSEPTGHEAAEQLTETVAAEYDAGGTILHHIQDSNILELPFLGPINLPEWHLELLGRSFDLSITKHVVWMWIAGAVLVLLFGLAARRKTSADRAPGGLRSALEALVLFVRDELARKNIGPGGDRFVPYLLTTFFFILLMNLSGLVPWGATATGNIGVTAALAGMAFLMIQWAGISEHGLVKHFMHLVPPGLPPLLLPIMIPVEILGMFAKPFALCVRLFANMTGGHVIILSLFSLIFILKTPWVAAVSVPFALFIYLLEIFVSFLQAYIFTMLTSLFMGMSAHPQH